MNHFDVFCFIFCTLRIFMLRVFQISVLLYFVQMDANTYLNLFYYYCIVLYLKSSNLSVLHSQEWDIWTDNQRKKSLQPCLSLVQRHKNGNVDSLTLEWCNNELNGYIPYQWYYIIINYNIYVEEGMTSVVKGDADITANMYTYSVLLINFSIVVQ